MSTVSHTPFTSPARRVHRRHSRWYTLWLLAVVFTLLISPFTGASTALGSPANAPYEQALDLLNRLTPEERVGQLFLVTFNGVDVGQNSQIYDLITNHYIGGVVLQRANDNFTSGSESLNDAVALTRHLQLDYWAASQEDRTDPISGQAFTPPFIPLFIGAAQEGDGYPNDQLLSGMTPLPNEMAIGATWNPELASQVGAVLGNELSILGINLLVGPSLDVLDTPHSEGDNDLGTRTFGGDPYWVSEMGSAYIEGVHGGSSGKVAVIAKHFPGHGGSDRLPEDEVATVPKPLEQLKNFELAPFFAVTGNAPTPAAATDGLLVSHIRYQGFQGNIRRTTRPVSFDPEAFKQLMSLPELASWRDNGGVMVSDDLGSQAVRSYYALTGQDFDMPRRVALNALYAGNDLLYVADFSSGELDSYNAALQTLEFFAQKYREGPPFSQRVDDAVLRILTLKFRLYGDLSLGRVLASPGQVSQIGRASQVTSQVAREAATLVSPSLAELNDTLPDPPNLNDRLVFITDDRTGQQCSQCPPQPLLGSQTLQQVVLRLFGPQSGRQVQPNNLASYSLADLEALLSTGSTNTDIEQNLQRANWIVFAMLNATSEAPSYPTLSRFLSQRPDLIQQKRIVVFAFSAPYYLDATNISKLTAFYALYSKAPPFIDVAAYLLFREASPSGASPVSVPGISYDLPTELFPDPSQDFLLLLDIPTAGGNLTTTTPAPSPNIEFKVGDMIPVRTDIIKDHNGHRVPDNTPVTFVLMNGSGDANPVRQLQFTANGIARAVFPVTTSGTLRIHGEVELPSLTQPARSKELVFEVPAPGNEKNTPTPTEMPSPTPTLTPTLTPAPPPNQEPPTSGNPRSPQLSDWLMALLITAGVAWSAYRLAALIGQVRWGVRSGFLALIGGLIAYSYLALQMPGTERFLNGSISRSVFLITLLGTGVGLLAAWSWRSIGIAGSEGTSTDKRPRGS